MNDTVLGLILKAEDYREYDALVDVLTKEYGRLTFRAAGSRKMTSRNAGSLLPYTEAELQFDYRPDRTLFTLKTARTRALYRHLHEDLDAGTAAAAAGEAAAAFSYSGFRENAASLYSLVQMTFTLLDQKKDSVLILSLFICDLLNLAGIGPNVDACVRDGKKLVSAISVQEGGFLCTECAQKENVKFRTAEELHLFRLLVKGGLAHYEEIEKLHADVSWCLLLLEQMLVRQGGINIRSFRLYNRLHDIDYF